MFSRVPPTSPGQPRGRRQAIAAGLSLAMAVLLLALLTWRAAHAGTIPPLLLTEAVVTPTEGEMVEIYNPGAAPVDLSDVYLTDATFAGGGTYYYNIVTGSNAGGGSFADFHARFPDGASIGPGEYQTISMAGSDDFFAEYGVNPTYELYEDGGSPDAIPDMREALPGSINGQGGLTNSGEVVILYYWDGTTDLVTDLDYLLWGDKDEAVDKTGVAIDGPDGDSDPSTYLDDTPIISQTVVFGDAHADGKAWQRADLSEGDEVQSGGNGAEGHDETSENLDVTWCEETPSPNAAGNCPLPPLLINETDADTSGTDTLEFVELYDGGAGNTPLNGLVVVFYNGSSDTSYAAFDLDGFSSSAGGYFTLGNAAVVPAVDLVFADNTLQNGADAVALYAANGSDFPDGTAVTTDNLIDAIVYDTDDADDAGLLVLLNPGQPQVNENGAGDKDFHSNQRCPNGEGGLRNTDSYLQDTPTPGSSNNCLLPDLGISKQGPAHAVIGESLAYTITVENNGNEPAGNVVVTDTLPLGTTYVADGSGWSCTGCTPGASGPLVWSAGSVPSNTMASFALTLTVDAGLDAGTVLTNSVELSSDLAGDIPDNNSDETTTTVFPLVTIPDIQSVPDPGANDDSPLLGQTVWVEGIVTAEPGELDDPNILFVIEEAAGGPWSGLVVFKGSAFSSLDLSEGTEVRVLGEVEEFFGLTELDVSGGWGDVQVLSSGNPVPGPDVLSTTSFDDLDANTSEQWEGVLVEFQGAAVTDDSLGFGEWQFDDGSGPARADDLGGEDGDLSYVPALGDLYAFIRGIGYYSFGNYKLEPRYDGDISLEVTAPAISKEAPILVAPGALYTYTITVENELGYTLNDLVISDTVPAGTAFAYANDGGSEAGGVVTWNLASLDNFGSASVSFAVTATLPAGTVVNDEYAVSASNFPTPTYGAPVATVVGTEIRIHDIQGAAHISPFVGENVFDVRGIVTALSSNGFWMQDDDPDADEATSEGIFVFTGGAPGVAVGDELLVGGLVVEFRSASTDLSTTELGGSPLVEPLSSGNPLPPPVIVGNGGRVPPDTIIEDDATGSVDNSGVFDPASDGIDFYESMEGMLLQVNDALVVGSNRFGEIQVVGDSGANAGIFSPRGALVVQQTDFNPERIILDDALVSAEPDSTVGDMFSAPVVGVLDYSFGNFKLLNFDPLPALIPGGLLSETTSLASGGDQLTVAAFNVENLDPNPNDGDDDTFKFAGLGDIIVNHLLSPDIIGLEEIQDSSGATDDGIVTATTTLETLVQAILDAGGPAYDYREIAPEDGQDGGQPGGNIRVAFLFRPDRVTFVDRGAGDATTATEPFTDTVNGGASLTLSPGRVDPGSFPDSRKPLAGEFWFNGNKLLVVVSHFNSKSGDEPLFGHAQPPFLGSEAERMVQAQAVHDFVAGILAIQADAKVIVMGDLNDFPFSLPVQTVQAGVLTNLMDSLPANEQYTFIFDGNSQVLDHLMASDNLMATASPAFDIVHVDAEYDSDVHASDHEPVMASFTLPFVSPDVVITKTVQLATDPPAPGDSLSYVVTVQNVGTATAYGVQVTDTLPAAVIGDDLMITVDLAPGALEAFNLPVEIAPDTWGQTVVNTASFSFAAGEGGSATASFTVAEAPTSVSLTSFGGGSAGAALWLLLFLPLTLLFLALRQRRAH